MFDITLRVGTISFVIAEDIVEIRVCSVIIKRTEGCTRKHGS